MKTKNIAVVSVVTIMALAAMWPVLAGVKPEQVVPGKDSGGQETEYPILTPEELECFYGIMEKSLLYTDLSGRNILKGIGAVRVLVESINPEIEKLGLTEQALQTDVELQLRKYGIEVRDKDELSGRNLYIHVTVMTREAIPVVFSINVEFADLVVPIRNPKIIVCAPVWRTGSVGTVGMDNVKQIRENVKDHVNEFINAYLAANPKEQPVKEDKKLMNK